MSQRDPAIRASDAERERAADALREHCAAGRLEPEELDERIDAVYAARTLGALRAVLADLPPLPAVAPRPGHDPEHERAKRRVLRRTGFWTVVCLAMVVIWAAGGFGYFWPIWVMLGGAIAAGTNAWSELGPGAADRRRLGRGSSRPPLPEPPTSQPQPQPCPPAAPAEQAREPWERR